MISGEDKDTILEKLEDIENLDIAEDRIFDSATHDEIRCGATTDVYFVKTKEILRHLDKEDTPVAAEIFANRSGVLAGVGEALRLLESVPVEVWAQQEGSEVQEEEVVMVIKGPYGAFGIYETALLGMLASTSGWATRARRVSSVTDEVPIVCFGARHVHPAVAPVMEKAAWVGGVDGVSCILAARLLGIEPTGTVPHAAVLITGSTVEVARAYHEVIPEEDKRVILVDTFHDEVRETMRVAQEMGEDLDAVRLDTPSERGRVTPALVRETRAWLDKEGFEHVEVFVSGGVDPERIPRLVEAGADGFGVGSYIAEADPLFMTMDIKEVDGVDVAKRGRLPGIRWNPGLKKRI